MEVISNDIVTKRELCIQNSFPLGKTKNEKSFYIYNNEINFNINTQNLYEKIINQNNTFYLNYLYFKHLNIGKEKSEEKLLKKLNISFKPKVSVIIPIYNVEKYLIICLNSIINQRLKEIEIICVNDGSTDDSLLILLNYSKLDNRIMIIDQRNRGLSEARNTGVKYSNGKFIYFIDSDDYLDQNALYELYEYGTKNNLDSIYFYFIRFKNNETFLEKNNTINTSNYILNSKNILDGKHLFVQLKKDRKYNPSACITFFKKQFYINAGLSFYPGILHEDELFTLTGILLAKRAFFLDKNYYYRRVHSNSIMNRKKDVKNLYGLLISYFEIIKKFKGVKFEKIVEKEINYLYKSLENRIKYLTKFLSQNEKKILFLVLTFEQKNFYQKL